LQGKFKGLAHMWESFGKATDKKRWVDLLNRSDFLGVRGPLSKQYLKDWGVTKEINVIGDPVMLLSREDIAAKQGRQCIGINLGPSRGFIFGQDENGILRFGSKLLRELKNRNWDITLFPMVLEDIDYLLQASRMAGIPKPKIHKHFFDLEGTLAALSKQDVFVGEKLHSIVLASCVGTPSIMLEYRSKCRDFMMSIEREIWCWRTDKLYLDQILDQLMDLHENIEIHQAKIVEQMRLWKRRLREASDRVHSIIVQN
jgi:polysaccharide pyruvyl transferase WcaK-like protein